jgi:hypothetical protein
MHPFHGDLLIGGDALRGLEGELEDEQEDWQGRFSWSPSRPVLLETMRSYLLMLDDGRAARVMLTKIGQENGSDALVVEFKACRSLP